MKRIILGSLIAGFSILMVLTPPTSNTTLEFCLIGVIGIGLILWGMQSRKVATG